MTTAIANHVIEISLAGAYFDRLGQYSVAPIIVDRAHKRLASKAMSAQELPIVYGFDSRYTYGDLLAAVTNRLAHYLADCLVPSQTTSHIFRCLFHVDPLFD